MPSTKSLVTMLSGQSVGAGATVTQSPTTSLATGYGAVLYLKITNGGTAPSTAPSVKLQISYDDSDYGDYGPSFVGDTTNSSVTRHFGFRIPAEFKYARLVCTGGTGQTVTVDAYLTHLTAL